MTDTKKVYDFVYVYDNSNRRHLYERCAPGQAILWFQTEYKVEKGAIDRVECLTETDDPNFYETRILKVLA